jgi:hypothetical protein
LADDNTEAIKIFAMQLKKIQDNSEAHAWYGDVTPTLPGTITVKLFLEDKLTAYQGKQVNNATILFLGDKFYASGDFVKGTLVSTLVSREYERRRHMTSKLLLEGGKDEHPDLIPMRKAGYGCLYDTIERIDAVSLGNRYSVFFLEKGSEKAICRINDVNEEELETIQEIFLPYNINWITTKFKIPLRDVLLFFVIGILLLMVGWFLIVLLFP